MRQAVQGATERAVLREVPAGAETFGCEEKSGEEEGEESGEMSENSKIEWTDHTFSPWWGCVEVSPACDNCYARTWAKRTGHNVWGKEAPRRFFSDKHWREPESWNLKAAKEGVRRRVFCGSMCDVMEDRRDLDEYRDRLYDLIDRTQWLDWLLLTKRPQNFRRLFPSAWIADPRPNVWTMTTVEAPEYAWRIDALRDTPAVMRGLSMEPLVAGFNKLDLSGIGFVIVGGESGPGARPMHPDWARDIRDQCASAGVAFFFKQWGEWQNGSGLKPQNDRVLCNDGMLLGMDLSDASYEVRTNWANYRSTVVSRVGKKEAGRLLDGREHNEMPEVRLK